MISFAKRYNLPIALIIFTGAFLFSRSLFFYWPAVDWTSDSLGYLYRIYRHIGEGYLPKYDFLPLGYPLFTFFIQQLSDSIYAVVGTQHFLTFFSGIVLIYAIHKFYGWISILTAVALCAWVLSSYSVYYDSMILSESLYTSNLVLLITFVIYCINRNKPIYWIILGFLLVYPLLTRPVGIFTLPLFLIIVGFLVINRQTFHGAIKPLTLTFGMLLFLFAAYNWVTINAFTIIIPSRVEALENYQDISKQSIVRVNQLGIETEGAHPPSIGKIKKHYYWLAVHKRYEQFLESIYNKFFVFNWPDNMQYASPDSLYLHEAMVEYGELYSLDNPDMVKRHVFKEFYEKKNIAYLEERYWEMRSSLVFKVYDWFQIKMFEPIFRNLLWVFLFFGIAALSLIVLVIRKFNYTGAFIVLVVCMINLGHSAIHIIPVQRTLTRYHYPIEFTYYLTVAMAPIIFRNRGINRA